MLTKKQHELLLFLEERMSETGVTPSFEEMKNKLSLKSKSEFTDWYLLSKIEVLSENYPLKQEQLKF